MITKEEFDNAMQALHEQGFLLIKENGKKEVTVQLTERGIMYLTELSVKKKELWVLMFIYMDSLT